MTADAVGGIWTYALELCRGLAAQRIQMVLAIMGRHLTEHERAALRRIPLLEVAESDYKLEWMENARRDVARAGTWLLNIEARERPDLVHLNGYAHGSLPWRAPCLIAGHSCVYSWFEAVRRAAPDAGWQDYRDAVSAGLASADLVTAPSRSMLRALGKHYGPFRTMGPVYNGRTPSFPNRSKESFVLTAGRVWDEAKNLGMLERAAAEIPWPIYAAGDRSAPGGGIVSLRGLHMLGRLHPEELAVWLSQAAIFVLPARYEPFGLALLEAGLAGCALVAGDIPSLREIWQDAALFVPPDDEKEISGALSRLIYDADRRNELAARARKRAREFTPERMTQAYLRLYRKLRAERDAPVEGRRNSALESGAAR